jgi:hypothetical protein
MHETEPNGEIIVAWESMPHPLRMDA